MARLRIVLDTNLLVSGLARLRLSESERRDLIDAFMFLADIVDPEATREAALRDPVDQPVLATWNAAQAQYLVTGDKDLLVLADRYPIVTPGEFWARHGG